MTLVEELFEKRASLESNLLGVFKKEVDDRGTIPVVRNSIYRGNSGRDHLIREGHEMEPVERIVKSRKEKSEGTVRRLLGMFSSDE